MEVKHRTTVGTDRGADPQGRHTAGVNAALADGSIRFVTNSIDLIAWQAAGSMNGGETIQLP